MAETAGIVLVTGVGGLIGAAVARQMTARGDAVIGLDRQRPAGAACPVLVQEIGDVHRLHEIVAGRGVRAIVHAGGASGPMVSPESPARVAAINIGGLIDVLEVARIHRIPRVVWFSSILAYGLRRDDAPVDEASALQPTNVYGASKVAGEALLRAYAAEHGVVGTALRVASCYGPGRTTNCFVRLLVENALAGRPTAVPFPDARSRQHIHIDDVVAAVLAVTDADRLASPVYNIAPRRCARPPGRWPQRWPRGWRACASSRSPRRRIGTALHSGRSPSIERGMILALHRG